MTDSTWALIIGFAGVFAQSFWKAYNDRARWQEARQERLDAAQAMADKVEQEALRVANEAKDGVAGLITMLTDQNAQSERDAAAVRLQVDANTRRLNEIAVAGEKGRAGIATKIDANAHKVDAAIAEAQVTIEKSHVTAEKSNHINEKLLQMTQVIASVQAHVEQTQGPSAARVAEDTNARVRAMQLDTAGSKEDAP